MRLLVVFFVATATLLFTAGLFLADDAEAKCQPPRPNDGNTYLAGMWRPVGYTNGAKAVIWNYDPYVSAVYHPIPGYKQYSTAWVMIAGDSFYQWAQIGWIQGREEYTNIYHRWTFVQWTDRAGNPTTKWYAPEPVNYWSGYVVVTAVNDTWWDFRAGEPSYEKHKVWIPATFIATTPEMGGEITSAANQMPGTTYADPERFTGAYFGQPVNAWVPFDGVIQANDWFYVLRYPTTPGKFDIWDKCDG